MTIPLITNLPIKNTDTVAAFNIKVDGLFPQLNTSIASMNADLTLANSNAVAASAAATSAALASTTAQANANYKGLWANLTGVLNIPASVFHLNMMWQLTSNLANVTTAIPGTSTSWLPVDNIGLIEPSVQTSLLMDFTNGQAVDSRLTFDRASTATRYNRYGFRESVLAGLPRIDFDPATLACNGLLVEEAATNNLLFSNDFTNLAWTKSNATVTANNKLGANNTLSASTVSFTSSTLGALSQNTTQAGTSSQTFSIDIGSTDCSDAQLSIFWTGSIIESVNLRFNPITGAVIAITNTLAVVEGYCIKPLKNGLFRVSASGRGLNAANTTVQFSLYEQTTSACSLFIGAAQGEPAAFMSSYTGATTTVAVTRVADSASITSLTTQPWFNSLEGTLVVESCLNSVDASARDTITVAFNDGTNANRILIKSYLNGGAANFQGVITIASTAVFSSPILQKLAGEFSKQALAYKANDNAYAINGSGLYAAASAIPAFTTMQLTTNGSQSIKSIAYYPTRLPNNELLAATRS